MALSRGRSKRNRLTWRQGSLRSNKAIVSICSRWEFVQYSTSIASTDHDAKPLVGESSSSGIAVGLPRDWSLYLSSLSMTRNAIHTPEEGEEKESRKIRAWPEASRPEGVESASNRGESSQVEYRRLLPPTTNFQSRRALPSGFQPKLTGGNEIDASRGSPRATVGIVACFVSCFTFRSFQIISSQPGRQSRWINLSGASMAHLPSQHPADGFFRITVDSFLDNRHQHSEFGELLPFAPR